jgi:hypothetical protein
MKDLFFLGILIFLQFSILLNIQLLISYFSSGKKGSLKGVYAAASVNLFIGIIILLIMVFAPDVVSKFELQSMTVPESGLIFCLLVFIKARIALRVFRRAKDPDYYDISFFGKKVYRLNVVKKSELAVFLLSMPVTLIAGAYFVVNIFV